MQFTESTNERKKKNNNQIEWQIKMEKSVVRLFGVLSSISSGALQRKEKKKKTDIH